jgi:hypothetical protein
MDFSGGILGSLSCEALGRARICWWFMSATSHLWERRSLMCCAELVLCCVEFIALST